MVLQLDTFMNGSMALWWQRGGRRDKCSLTRNRREPLFSAASWGPCISCQDISSPKVNDTKEVTLLQFVSCIVLYVWLIPRLFLLALKKCGFIGPWETLVSPCVDVEVWPEKLSHWEEQKIGAWEATRQMFSASRRLWFGIYASSMLIWISYVFIYSLFITNFRS